MAYKCGVSLSHSKLLAQFAIKWVQGDIASGEPSLAPLVSFIAIVVGYEYNIRIKMSDIRERGD